MLKKIKKRFIVNIIFAIMSLFFLIYFLVILKHNKGLRIILFAFTLFVLAIVFISLSIYEYRKLCLARLITENSILDVQAVEYNGEYNYDIKFIISCFGILLGSKVIKFNIDKILLKEVKISKETISIFYGKGSIRSNIKLLHGIKNGNELLRVIEKFRFETGITPIVLD